MVSTQGVSGYLCPAAAEYLPNTATVPTSVISGNTMDNSKTPLQMLAQTCNSIGLPDPPSKSKSILPLSESKSHKADSSACKSLSDVGYDRKSSGGSSKLDLNSSSSGNNGGSGDKETGGSGVGERSKSTDKNSEHSGDTSSDKIDLESNGTTKASPRPTNGALPESKHSIGSNHCSSATTGQALPPTLPPTGAAPKCGGCIPPYGPGSLLTSYPFGTTSSALPYPHSLSALSPGGYSASLHAAAAAASLPPFMPACRDPFCKTCPAAASSLALGGTPNPASVMNGGRCPLGCAQCTPTAHELWWLSAHPLFSSGFSGITPNCLPTVPVSLPLSGIPGLSSLYTHPAALASAASAVLNNGQQTGVCNWVTGEAGPCGKRFATNEELLQHLRTHTDGLKSPSENASVPATMPPTTSNAMSAPLNPSNPLLGLSNPPAAHSGRLSPRTYLSSLASFQALNRYHPYKPITMGAGQTSAASSLTGPMSHLPFPGGLSPSLGYPLGALYGQRLPGSLPHP